MKDYNVYPSDVIEFLKGKRYNCTGRITTDMQNFNDINDCIFDKSPVYFEWIDATGNKAYNEIQVSAFNFYLIEVDCYYGKKDSHVEEFSQQWRNYQLEKHQEEYLPHLKNWAAKHIRDAYIEKEKKLKELDQERSRINLTYESSISYYVNYIKLLTEKENNSKNDMTK